jgi:predicted alpha/beta hydrolase family esterase
MVKKVLLLHGWGGSDFPHWQSFLASELAKDYGKVSFLRFSEVDFPKLGMWIKELKKELKSFQPDIVVCHSLANTLWFHLCNESDIKQIEKLYLVAPPSINCDIKELESFFPVEIPKNPHAKSVKLITSTNDPYLTQDEAKELERSLGVDMLVLEDAGHINTDSGYGEWSWIVQDIKRSIKID